MSDERDPRLPGNDHDHKSEHEQEPGHRGHVPGHEELELAFDHEHQGLSTGRDPAPHSDAPHFGEPPEADQLAVVAQHDDVRMVVVTVGANDVGFGGLVAECAVDWARSPEGEEATCHRDAEAQIRAALSAATRGITAALHGIRRTLRAAGYPRSDYRLVAMGYASPFPEGRTR